MTHMSLRNGTTRKRGRLQQRNDKKPSSHMSLRTSHYQQKHPAGPGTVLVKPHFLKKMSMALWRNDDFCIIETLKFWIHFLDVFVFYYSASSFSSAHLTLGILHLFLRRCASKCPEFFFCKLAWKLIYPPLPTFAVEQQVAAMRRQTVWNVIFQC